ncbi:putative leucine-rich repeat-containing protein DDB_G0290503 [Chironomus tepperi]|uniref:putative leucine-rich repeat-containing protein DDB_G0290503 n=1 Tax=Chironomus tepperi TaxID=113505 RepID=UPI00391F435E
MEIVIDSNERKVDGNVGDKINEIAGNQTNDDEGISMNDKDNRNEVHLGKENDQKDEENVKNQETGDEKLTKNLSMNSASSAENDYQSSNPSIKSSEFSNLSSESVKYEVLNVSSDTQESQSFDDNYAGNAEVEPENLLKIEQDSKLMDINDENPDVNTENLHKVKRDSELIDTNDAISSGLESKSEESSKFGSELVNKIRYFEENTEILEDSEDVVEDMETKFEKFGEIMKKIEESDEKIEELDEKIDETVEKVEESDKGIKEDFVKLSEEVDNGSTNLIKTEAKLTETDVNLDDNAENGNLTEKVNNGSDVLQNAEEDDDKIQNIIENSDTIQDNDGLELQEPDHNAKHAPFESKEPGEENKNLKENVKIPEENFEEIDENPNENIQSSPENVKNSQDIDEYDLEDFNPEDPNEDSQSPIKKSIIIPQNIEEDSKTFVQEVMSIEDIPDILEEDLQEIDDQKVIDDDNSDDKDPKLLDSTDFTNTEVTNLHNTTSDSKVLDDEVTQNLESEIADNPQVSSKITAFSDDSQNLEDLKSVTQQQEPPIKSPDYYHEIDSKATTAEMKDDEFNFKSPHSTDISKIIEQKFTVDQKSIKKSAQGNESEISALNDIELSQQNVNEAATGSDNVNETEKEIKVEFASQNEGVKEIGGKNGNSNEAQNLIVDEKDKDIAAVKIQSMFRGYQVRKTGKIQKFEEKFDEIVNNKFEPKVQEPSEFGNELVSKIRDFEENAEVVDDSEEVVEDMETKFEKFGEIMRKIEESDEKIEEIDVKNEELDENTEESDKKVQESDEGSDEKVEEMPESGTNAEEVDGNVTEISKDEDFIDILLDEPKGISIQETAQQLEPSNRRTKRSISPETGETIENQPKIDPEDSWTEDFDALKSLKLSAPTPIQYENIENQSNLPATEPENPQSTNTPNPETSNTQDGIDEVDTKFDGQFLRPPDDNQPENPHSSYPDLTKVINNEISDNPEPIKHENDVNNDKLIEAQTKAEENSEINNFGDNEEAKINEIMNGSEQPSENVNRTVNCDVENPQSDTIDSFNIDTRENKIDEELKVKVEELSNSAKEEPSNVEDSDAVSQINEEKADNNVDEAIEDGFGLNIKSIDESNDQKVDETILEELNKQPEDSSGSDAANDSSGFNYEVLPSPPTDSPGNSDNDEIFDEIVRNLSPNSKGNDEFEVVYEELENVGKLDENTENLNKKVETLNENVEKLSENLMNLSENMEIVDEEFKKLDENSAISETNPEELDKNVEILEDEVTSPENSDNNTEKIEILQQDDELTTENPENPIENPENPIESTEPPENPTKNAQIFDKYLDIYDENLENFEYFTNNPDGTLKKSHKIVEKLNEIVDDEVAKYVEKMEAAHEPDDVNLETESEQVDKIEPDAQFDIFEFAVPNDEVDGVIDCDKTKEKSIDLPLVFKKGEEKSLDIEPDNMENLTSQPEVVEEEIIKQEIEPNFAVNVPIPSQVSPKLVTEKETKIDESSNEKENAAVKIQSFFRGFKVRKTSKPKRKSAKKSKDPSIFGNELVDKIHEFEENNENLENSEEIVEDMETKFEKFGEIMKKIEESEEKIEELDEKVDIQDENSENSEQNSDKSPQNLDLNSKNSAKNQQDVINVNEATASSLETLIPKTSNPNESDTTQDHVSDVKILNPLEGFEKMSQNFEQKLEENSAEEAAVKIQSLFRGFKVRKSQPPRKYKHTVNEPSAFGSELVDKIEEFEEKHEILEDSEEVVEDMEVKFEKFGEIMKKIEESEETKENSENDNNIEIVEEKLIQKHPKLTENQPKDKSIEDQNDENLTNSNKSPKIDESSTKPKENTTLSTSSDDKNSQNHSESATKASNDDEQANAAIKIQSFFRGFKVRKSNPTKSKIIQEPSEFGSELVEKIQDFEENSQNLENLEENPVDMEEKFEKFGEIMRKIEESDEKLRKILKI